MTSRDRVLAALAGDVPDRVPFMEWYFDLEIGRPLLGRDSYTREDVAEFLQMDGLGVYRPPPIYSKRAVSSAGHNYELGGLLRTRSDLSMIDLPSIVDGVFLDPVREFVERNGGRYATFVGTHLGMDPLLRGMGIDGFSYALADDPAMIDEVLDIYTDWAAEFVQEVQSTGIDIVWFADDIAFTTSLMFAPDWFRQNAIPHLRKVTGELRLPSIYHSDGHIVPVIDDLLDLGIDGLHPMDPCALDICQVKRDVGERCCLIGNIDLSYTLVLGTPAETREEVVTRMSTVGDGGGYIVSSANSITEYCKPENVVAMRDAILECGWYDEAGRAGRCLRKETM